MGSARAEAYAKMYRKAVDATVKTAESVKDDQLFRQVADEKAHPLWLLGHLAMSLDMLTNNWMLGVDMQIPAAWGQTFGPKEFGGTAITTKPDDYPAWSEVVAAYKKAGDAAVAKISSLTDAELDGDALGPMPDQFKETFGVLDTSLPANAIHDTHHRGQMTVLLSMP